MNDYEVLTQFFDVNGNCRPACTVTGEKYRFSFLSSRLVRMEYSEKGVFEDRPTKFAINRDFDVPEIIITDTGNELMMDTEWLSVRYNKKTFSKSGLSVKVRSECCGIYCVWKFGDEIKEGLDGTTRTLDMIEGKVKLQSGIQSRIGGFGVIDDSNSPVLTKDGHIEERQKDVVDVYLFGYGFEYNECLKHFFHLSGKQPILPRYALGNWWSRFYPYNQQEFLDLMNEFKVRKIPLSVAVIDIDWHTRGFDFKYGKDWTGYTWNKQLFPNPSKFLENLHEDDLAVTLNLHPAEGIQPNEEKYKEFCNAYGQDSSKKQPIYFNFCNSDFRKLYFELLLHSQGKKDVDFWWIDWQQGDDSSVVGADPLWLLNHYHFLDMVKLGRRPMIFSRYAGPGSHRYPIGFSGDTIISWKSLEFQPYFTSTAANIGYGWWSHDIGGHTGGIKDDELMVRWVQFGVFSPIMRLHSTSNLFNGKEPWKFSEQACTIITEFMRLRHQLIPYLYSENVKCHLNDTVLVKPMYYEVPQKSETYSVPNEYSFGTELIVAQITEPMDKALKLSKTTAWLPEGNYYDIFNGRRYLGNRKIVFYRGLDSIPVLAKAGSIIPLNADGTENGVKLPETLRIKVFTGVNGEYKLYEDDGEAINPTAEDFAISEFRYSESGNSMRLQIGIKGNISILPHLRNYVVEFYGIDKSENTCISINNKLLDFSTKFDKGKQVLEVSILAIEMEGEFCIDITHCNQKRKKIVSEVYNLLCPMQIEYELKQNVFLTVMNSNSLAIIISELHSMKIKPDLLGAISEILFAERV